MAIPDFQSLMLPVLGYCRDRKEHTLIETLTALADSLGLDQEECERLLPSGKQTVFSNRVGWARSYMKQAGLLESTRRGVMRITQRGLEVLENNPERIDIEFLNQFPEFVEFRTRKRGDVQGGDAQPEEAAISGPGANDKTPEERLEDAYQKIRDSLATDVLQQLKSCDPSFFERLVVDVLLKMGYGGTRQDAGRAIGKSGDGGVDGIIKEDRLGLDVIYIQAKRWQGTVGRPEIQRFVGALSGLKAKKGVFITTSDFTKEALDYAMRVDVKVVLIGGESLAQLMIDHGVGVSTIATYEIKRIDLDYFADV